MTTFAKLDPSWLASFWVAASANRITLQQLGLAACKSNDIVVNLFLLATSLSPKLPVPESLRAKDQVLLFLRSRIGKLCRMPAIIQNLAADGTYDVKKRGAFPLVFQEGRAKEIRHIGGAVAAVPSHVLVTDKLKMRNWHCDATCMVELAPAKHVLKTFFSNNIGPNIVSIPAKHLEFEVSQAISQASQYNALPALDAKSADESLQMSKRQRKDETAAKAKHVLEEYRAKHTHELEVSFEQAPVAQQSSASAAGE